jgi:hypothetical protein
LFTNVAAPEAQPAGSEKWPPQLISLKVAGLLWAITLQL